MTMIGQRDVRCCDEIRNRRTRNIRKIWAEMAALGFMRKVSVSRSEEGEKIIFLNPCITHWERCNEINQRGPVPWMRGR